CWLLCPRGGEPTVFIHFFNHQPCAKAQSIANDVRWYGPAPIPTLADAIRQRDLAKSKIGLVSMRGMAYGHVTELQRFFLKLNSSSSARHSVESAESEARRSWVISEGVDISRIWLARHWRNTLDPPSRDTTSCGVVTGR